MPVDRDNLERVLDAFEQGEWDEIHLVTGDIELHLSTRTGDVQADNLLDKSAGARRTSAVRTDVPATAEPTMPSTAATMVTATDAPAAGSPTEAQVGPLDEVVAPSPGIFWRSPRPGAPPFADVGDHVGPGSTMCIVEVMKLMNHVTAECAGTVVEVLVGNGEQVDRGQPLFRIRPDGA